jgi:GTP-binding protein HflX
MDECSASLEELSELAKTAGASVVDMIIQNRNTIDPKYYIGKGKIGEIREFYADEAIDLAIFDNELAPAQARNIEKAVSMRVITRTELIMDIFAIRAKTQTSRLQVELAQLKYLLPRIIGGKGLTMSRIEGGIGMRGPGEKQLETDRRYIKRRIYLIEQKLKKIDKVKTTQRKKRMEEFKIAIVGYTNSGKSTLLNRLVKSEVFAENRLFATLDTTTRKLWLGDGINVVITDTVGFIGNLPTGLIESFKSTLADTINADLLIHLADISSPYYQDQIQVVETTTREIGADKIPVLLCFNKIDRINAESLLETRRIYPDAIFISAKDGTYIENLKERLKDSVKKISGINESPGTEDEK